MAIRFLIECLTNVDFSPIIYIDVDNLSGYKEHLRNSNELILTGILHV